MKREIMKDRIGMSLSIGTDYTYGDNPFSIEELQQFLTKAKENGGTHICVTGDVYEGALDSVEIDVMKVYTESEEAFNKRVEAAEAKKRLEENLREAGERDLYERLKLKYGSDG